MSLNYLISRAANIHRLLLSSCQHSINLLSKMEKHSQTGLLTIFEKNPKRMQRIQFLGKLFETRGYELRIAGGAVRDILSGVEPTDIDFATTALPEQSLELLREHEDIFRIIVSEAGQRHGTVAVKFKEIELDLKKIKLSPDPEGDTGNLGKILAEQTTKPEYDDESPYEITTLRCDLTTDGRRAEVKFVNDWHIDAERRDLTINAMFLTLDGGKLIDYFDGESDLEKGIVRFVGNADARIKEDYLRILRYFRFWSRYGRAVQPDQVTLNTLKNNLDGLRQISAERIWLELKKILSYTPSYDVFNLMLDLNLFDYLEFTNEKLIQNRDEYNKQVLEDLKIVEANIQRYSAKLKDAQTTHSSDKKIKELFPVLLFTTAIRSHDMLLYAHKRLKLSNLERDSIYYIVDKRNEQLDIKHFEKELAQVHKPDRAQTLTKIKILLVCQGKLDLISHLDQWQIPDFPITGTSVKQATKEKKIPVKYIRLLLETLKVDWAESDFKLTEEELIQRLLLKCDELQNNLASSEKANSNKS